MSLSFHRRDAQVQIARLGGLVMVRVAGLVPEVHGDPNTELFEALDLAAAQPRVALIAHVVDSRPPPEASRAAFTDKVRDISEKLACAIICLEGGGFRAAGFRAFLGMLRATRLLRIPIEIRADLVSAQNLLADAFPMDEAMRDEVKRFFAGPSN